GPAQATLWSGRRGSCRGSCCYCARRRSRAAAAATDGRAARGRINHVLAVVREFVKHQVAQGRLDARVLAALYEVGDDRFLPAELRAEDGGLRYRIRPRHRLRAERPGRERAASQREWEALLRATGSW